MREEGANVQLIHRIYAAFEKRDFEAVLATFDPAVEWIAAEHSPLADHSPYRGLDAVRTGVFERIRAGFQRLSIEVDEMIAAGDKVVALGHYAGVRAGQAEPFRAQVAHVWTLDQGRIRRFQQYLDTYQLAQVMKA